MNINCFVMLVEFGNSRSIVMTTRQLDIKKKATHVVTLE